MDALRPLDLNSRGKKKGKTFGGDKSSLFFMLLLRMRSLRSALAWRIRGKSQETVTLQKVKKKCRLSCLIFGLLSKILERDILFEEVDFCCFSTPPGNATRGFFFFSSDIMTRHFFFFWRLPTLVSNPDRHFLVLLIPNKNGQCTCWHKKVCFQYLFTRIIRGKR